MFRNTNFKPNTILATLPELYILGKTRMSYFVEKDSYDMPLAYKIYWIFHNISLNAAPVISVIYWLVVFGKELQKILPLP